VLTDGGKGQLVAAARAMHEIGLEALPTASIAKREELLFLKGKNEPVRLDHHSPVLHLIQMIRDETHRFVVTYHRKRRAMRNFTSELNTRRGPEAESPLASQLRQLEPCLRGKRGRTETVCGRTPGSADCAAFGGVGGWGQDRLIYCKSFQLGVGWRNAVCVFLEQCIQLLLFAGL
jgi:hypothetical protein